MNEPMHQKFGMQIKAPYGDGTSKMGGLYFKLGKDAWMSSNLKALWHDQKIDVFSQVQECRSNK